MVMKKPNISLGLRARLLLPGLLLVSGTASAGYADLAVPLIGQQYDQWCHAASIDMVATYWGESHWTQCDIVKKEFNSTSCPNQPTSSIGQTCDGLRRMGYSCTVYYSALAFSSAFSEIYTYRRPFIPRIGWTSGGGHLMVIKAADNVSPYYVKYNNPLPVGQGSASSWVTYSYFKSNSTWTWTHTVSQIYK
jgi:hypothetical protein